jgi:hypothetical protein
VAPAAPEAQPAGADRSVPSERGARQGVLGHFRESSSSGARGRPGRRLEAQGAAPAPEAGS